MVVTKRLIAIVMTLNLIFVLLAVYFCFFFEITEDLFVVAIALILISIASSLCIGILLFKQKSVKVLSNVASLMAIIIFCLLFVIIGTIPLDSIGISRKTTGVVILLLPVLYYISLKFLKYLSRNS